jgi:hypothetical protein
MAAQPKAEQMHSQARRDDDPAALRRGRYAAAQRLLAIHE